AKFTPWPTTALRQDDRPTQPTPIRERLPAATPARLAPQPLATPRFGGGRSGPAVLGGAVLLVALIVIGLALAGRDGAAPHRYYAVGGALAPAPVAQAGAAQAAAPGDLSRLSEADLLPSGVPV